MLLRFRPRRFDLDSFPGYSLLLKPTLLLHLPTVSNQDCYFGLTRSRIDQPENPLLSSLAIVELVLKSCLVAKEPIQ